MAYPTDPLNVIVELFIDGSWTDITDDVFARGNFITIRRGFPNEGTSPEPGSMTFELRNVKYQSDGVTLDWTGRYSPRNPSSIYYGLIGRNTPVRVRVDESFIAEADQIRFVGEISEWPSRWDVSGRDVWVPITAQGILRRLGQGKSPKVSSLRRHYDTVSPSPQSYWPLEDDEDVRSAKSGLAGGTALTFNGPVAVSYNVPIGALSGLRSTGGSTTSQSYTAYVSTASRVYTAGSNELVLEVWLTADATASAPTGNDSVQMQFAIGDPASPFTNPHLQVRFTATVGSPNSLNVQQADGTDADSITLNPSVNILDGDPHHIRVECVESAGSTTTEVFLDGVSVGSGTQTSVGLVNIDGVTAARSTAWFVGVTSHFGLPIIFSHLAVFDDVSVTSSYDAGIGYRGETAAARAVRAADEADVSLTLVGSASDTQSMGGQVAGQSFLDALDETWRADMALVFESRGSLGLSWRTRRDLYNQVAVTLDYSAPGEVASLEPTDDDQATRNDITVKRKNGGQVRVTQADGTLGTSAVGVYDEEVELNVESDEQLDGIARWRLHAQALTADEQTRWMVAAHECGHIIAACHYKAYVNGVKLIPGQGAHTDLDRHGDPWIDSVIAAAGAAATLPFALAGDDQDRAAVAELVGAHRWGEAVAEAQKILHRHSNQMRVLVDALRAMGELSGEEIDRVLGRRHQTARDGD